MAVTKLWANRSYETANLIVTFGYTLGAIPVRWNKEQNKMEPVTSRRDMARWILSILYVSCWEVAISVNFLRQVLAVEMENRLQFVLQDANRVGIVSLSFVIFFLHLHTAWKYKEFVTFINRAADFYEYFQSKLGLLLY